MTLLQIRVYDELKPPKPNFLTQFSFEISVAIGKESQLLSQVVKTLTNFSYYDDIPYYSKLNDSWHELFYDVELSNTLNDSWAETLHLRMKAFEPGIISFTMEIRSNGIIYYSTNTISLKLGIIQANGTGK